ncbi:MAG: transcriptional repressor LexA [Halorhodospira halophila]|uniref:transcriptional repressor LexA n=1 Tax=Halorhodospira TaxID=85108 RepID=UPI00191378C8|nr:MULTISPECIES: transcriptional repressor LexA [Halorhodospira]MBK5936199.1 repressor LexA [Halorhodospira halophila]MBK5944058.1 repressor LexA [Halorhodospira halophila]MCC3749908.1 transcriptional repressor LexA [Halorhodospira halophila]MCG5527828.1 transcriptional repressor LexA [Halorhodospira halophila]MCG5532820.1 transcriptional repressor LexA [Halorhodospira sp. 9621]
MDTLTDRQREILELIRRSVAERGYPPTRAEICQSLGFRSPNAAESHLRALARKGAIEMRRGASRGIRLTDAAARGNPEAPRTTEETDGTGLPVVGRVAAGSPLLAEESIERYCQVDAALFSPPADYLLRVRGESMRDAGILDGDLLAVRRDTEARDGQIVVIRLHDEVTVKFLERRDGVLRLIPAHPDYPVIEVAADGQDAVLEGIGVGVLRSPLHPRGPEDDTASD